MSTFTGPVKAFCPCDAGRPQDCKPEEWRPAHAPATCTTCGKPRYQHTQRPDGLARDQCPNA